MSDTLWIGSADVNLAHHVPAQCYLGTLSVWARGISEPERRALAERRKGGHLAGLIIRQKYRQVSCH